MAGPAHQNPHRKTPPKKQGDGPGKGQQTRPPGGQSNEDRRRALEDRRTVFPVDVYDAAKQLGFVDAKGKVVADPKVTPEKLTKLLDLIERLVGRKHIPNGHPAIERLVNTILGKASGPGERDANGDSTGFVIVPWYVLDPKTRRKKKVADYRVGPGTIIKDADGRGHVGFVAMVDISRVQAGVQAMGPTSQDSAANGIMVYDQLGDIAKGGKTDPTRRNEKKRQLNPRWANEVFRDASRVTFENPAYDRGDEGRPSSFDALRAAREVTVSGYTTDLNAWDDVTSCAGYVLQVMRVLGQGLSYVPTVHASEDVPGGYAGLPLGEQGHVDKDSSMEANNIHFGKDAKVQPRP